MITYCILDRHDNIVLENQIIKVKENRTGQCAVLQIEKEGIPIVLVPTSSIIDSAIEYEVENYKLHMLPQFVTLRKECITERRVENDEEKKIQSERSTTNNVTTGDNEETGNKKKQEQTNSKHVQQHNDNKERKRRKNNVVRPVTDKKKKAGRQKTDTKSNKTANSSKRKPGKRTDKARRKHRT